MKTALLFPIAALFLGLNAPTQLRAAAPEKAAVVPSSDPPKPTEKSPIKMTDIRIILHTDKGDIEATLFASQTPITVANYLNLAKKEYYNDIKFHRLS